MSRFQLSLRKWMIAYTVTLICLATIGSHFWRNTTAPDLTFEMVVHFSQSYSPPILNNADVEIAMRQLTTNPQEKDLLAISETIANADLRVFPWGNDAVQIVASGRSWQMAHERIELLACAAAELITHEAVESGVGTSIDSQCKMGERRGLVPKSILAVIDGTKR